MAKLSFRIEAEWEKVQKLREEIERLKRSIDNTDAVQNPVAFNKLNSKLQQTSQELNSVTGNIAKTAAAIDTNFKQKIYDASQSVNHFSEEIIKQKKIIADTKDDIRTLSEQYRKMGSYEKTVSPIGGKLQQAKDALAEQKYSLFTLTQEQAKARLSVTKLRDEYALLRKEGGGTADMMNMLTSKVKQMGTVVLGGMGLKELASRIISVRSEFESMETSLKVLLGGNQKRLNEIMGQIKEYALASPLNTKDMVGAVQMMTSFGIEAEKSIDYLKAIGDISMGDTGKFNSLALAFSQMSSAGKLMGQDLMQMVNAGFNPLEEIARKTGKSIGELKEEMSKGAISSKMVQDAFISATSAGGKFFGMSQEGAKTLNGQISMLQESFDMMFNEIGQKGEGVIMGTVKAGTYLVEHYEQVGKILEGVVVAYGSYKAALLVNIALEKVQAVSRLAHARNIGILSAATGVLKGKVQALNITMLKNPYALVFAALVTIGYEMYRLSKQSDTASAAQKRLKDANNEVEKSTQMEISKLNGLRAELEQSKKGTDKWKSAKDAIISQYGQYDSKLAAEIDRTGTLTSSYNNLTTAIRKSVAARQLKQFYDSNMQETQDEIQSRRNEIYKGLKKQYSQQTSNLLMKYVNQYISTGKGLDQKITYKGKPTTVRNMINNVHGSLFGFGGGSNAREARELQVNSDKAVKDFVAMNNISQAEANEILYGIKPTEKEKTATTKNRKYWEDKKKDAQSKLDALSYIEAKGKKGQALKKKIASYDKYLSAYPVSTNAGGHSGGRGHSGVASEIQEKKIVTPWGQSDEVAELATKGIQSYIDAMQEGYEKEKKQRDFNHVQELADLDKYKHDYLNKKRDNAKEKFEADPKNKGKKFNAASVKLTQDEQDKFDKIRSNIREKHANEDKEAENEMIRNERAAWQEYYHNFGTYVEQKQALEQEAEQKIQNIRKDETITQGNKDAQIKAVDAGLKKSLNELNFKELKEEINWEYIFGDLDNTMPEVVAAVKNQLQQFIDTAKELTPEQIQTVTDAIENLQARMDMSQPIKSIKQAHKEFHDAKAEYDKQLKAFQAAKKAGDKPGAEKAAKGMIKSSQKMTKAANKEKRSYKSVLKVVKDYAKTLSDLGDSIGGNTGKMLKMAASAVTCGINMAQGIQSFKAALTNLERSVAILAIIQAALQALQLIMSLFSDDDKSTQNYLEGMGRYISFLKDNINELDKSMKDVKKTICETNDVFEELQNKRQETANAIREKSIAWLNSGASVGFLGIGSSASEGVKITDSLTSEQKNALKRYRGSYEFGRMGWIWDLADDEIIKLSEDAMAMSGLGDTLASSVKDYVEQIKAMRNGVNEQREALLGFSFNDFYDDFSDMLKDMDSDSEKFSQNFAEYMRNALAKDVLAKGYKSELEAIYKEAADIIKSGTHSGENFEALKKRYEELSDRAKKEVEVIDQITGYKEEKDDDEQRATSNGVANITYEQASNIVALTTAGNISRDQIKDVLLSQKLSSIDLSLTGISLIGKDTVSIADETRTILANSYMELKEINENTGVSAKCLTQIDENINSMNRLIKEKL